tara:strand:+ start:1453 stop:3447 length:1995 start_codon:yes stop_codon:yes gene_type:complete
MIRVERLGYAPTEVVISDISMTDRLVIDLEESALELEGLVVTGALSERAQDQAIRPTSVISQVELQRKLVSTVASTLKSEPGIAVSTMGPAASLPVIRGLSGDRLLVLEDGVRITDVSNTHADHANAINPMSARRIEVVRGPGAIIYGSNAIGGVINVIRDEIPDFVPEDVTGTVTLQGQSVTSGAGGAASMFLPLAERVPLRLEASYRTSGDLKTPLGSLGNTGVDSWSLAAGTSWVGDRGYVGLSGLGHVNNYGIPGGFVGGHEAGVGIESERVSFKAVTERRELGGPFTTLNANASFSYYDQLEMETPTILGTRFQRQSAGSDVIARFGSIGPISSGALGGRASWESFGFGGSLYTPNSERLNLGVFTYQEIDLDPVRLEAGIRYDWTQTTPEREDRNSDIGHVRRRTFASLSGSVGLLYNWEPGFVMGANVSRAFRTPDVHELFSEGPHLAAYSFDVGNPDLEREIGTGLDIFMRFHDEGNRVHAELSGFANWIDGYVYGEDTGKLSRTRLPIYQYFGDDAAFKGFEAEIDWVVSGAFKAAVSGAYVRGEIRESLEPLPLMPPLRGQLALAYEPTDWFVRLESTFAARQDRIGEFETATDGYERFDLVSGVSRTIAGRLNVLTISVENLTDEAYRNHLSRVKEFMPEAGRGVTVNYRVVF